MANGVGSFGVAPYSNMPGGFSPRLVRSNALCAKETTAVHPSQLLGGSPRQRTGDPTLDARLRSQFRSSRPAARSRFSPDRPRPIFADYAGNGAPDRDPSRLVRFQPPASASVGAGVAEPPARAARCDSRRLSDSVAAQTRSRCDDLAAPLALAFRRTQRSWRRPPIRQDGK